MIIFLKKHERYQLVLIESISYKRLAGLQIILRYNSTMSLKVFLRGDTEYNQLVEHVGLFLVNPHVTNFDKIKQWATTKGYDYLLLTGALGIVYLIYYQVGANWESVSSVLQEVFYFISQAPLENTPPRLGFIDPPRLGFIESEPTSLAEMARQVRIAPKLNGIKNSTVDNITEVLTFACKYERDENANAFLLTVLPFLADESPLNGKEYISQMPRALYTQMRGPTELKNIWTKLCSEMLNSNDFNLQKLANYDSQHIANFWNDTNVQNHIQDEIIGELEKML